MQDDRNRRLPGFPRFGKHFIVQLLACQSSILFSSLICVYLVFIGVLSNSVTPRQIKCLL